MCDRLCKEKPKFDREQRLVDAFLRLPSRFVLSPLHSRAQELAAKRCFAYWLSPKACEIPSEGGTTNLLNECCDCL